MSYFYLIPKELQESIVYLLDLESLINLITTYPNLKIELNWSIILNYRGCKHNNIDYDYYITMLSILKQIYTIEDLMELYNQK